jgi:hypothetical protein
VRSTSDVNPILLRAKYKSKLEEKVAKQLEAEKLEFTYESFKIHYVIPSRKASYRPDFIIGNMMIETKGYFRSAADRQKLLLVKEQYPELDLRLLFQNANLPIYKGSKTTYAQWAESNGFLYADKGTIPQSWLMELKTK